MTDKALLLGINNYESISDLSGCENDVDDVFRLLTETCGFAEGNVRQLRNEEAIQGNLRDGFKWLVLDARPGDRLVFHFSGHGSYLPSEDADEDVDELICLYDMNWADSDSFLIDDDLGNLAGSVPPGARLTIILDSCHSGTGTRGLRRRKLVKSLTPKTSLMVLADTAAQISGKEDVDTQRRLEKGDEKLLESLGGETPPVLARFVQPPKKYRITREIGGIRRLGRSLARAELNHQLMAAAKDKQTAADAFIDGDYHGAFSYYLCDSARKAGPDATVRQVMEAAVRAINSAGYSQTPQTEGPYLNDQLFGTAEAVGPVAPIETGPSSPPTASGGKLRPGAIGSNAQAYELLTRALSVSEKFLDLAEKLVVLPREYRPVSGVLRTGSEHVVYVHGIGDHRPGFSDSWWDSMRPFLTQSLNRDEVVWSHIVNSRQARSEAAARSADVQKLRRQLDLVLRDRLAQLESDRPISQERAAVDDFIRYMLFEDVRDAILAEFDTVVRPLMANGNAIHVISHSWGTVVAYEGLRNLDAASLTGRVANLFLVGSALSIGPVQDNLFGRVDDGRKPTVVDRIINLDATSDIVGGRIGNAFTIDEEFLGLSPVGCATIPFTDIALSPSCAHGSYFDAENRRVNRDIFARFIES